MPEDRDDPEFTLKDLATKVAALEAECAAQRSELALLGRASRAAPTASVEGDRPGVPGSGYGEDGARVSRRGALRALGAATAGGAALAIGSTFLGAEPAFANNGDTVILGTGNQAHDSTQVETDTLWGWIGSTSDPSSSGVGGVWGLDASAVGGYGVLGESTKGTGVYGQSVGASGLVPFHKISGVVGDNNSGQAGVTGLCNGGDTSWGVHGIGGSGAGDIPGASAGVFGESGDAFGVGVYGVSTQSDGVQGYSVNGTGSGVHGVGAEGSGSVPGVATGVFGESGLGYGVYGASLDGIGVVAVGGTAPLRLVPATSGVGPPTNGQHRNGEVFVDSLNSVFLCVGRGTPGVWRQLGAAAPNYNDNNAAIGGSLGVSGSLNLLAAPIRVFDTTVADPPADKKRAAGPLAAGSVTYALMTGYKVNGIEVPPLAVAVLGTLTALNPTGSGALTLYPMGGKVPVPPTLSFTAGATASTLCVVALNAAGKLSIAATSATGCTFDVAGFLY